MSDVKPVDEVTGSAVPESKATEKLIMLVAQAYAAGFREAYDVIDPDAPQEVVTLSLKYNFGKWLGRNPIESLNVGISDAPK